MARAADRDPAGSAGARPRRYAAGVAMVLLGGTCLSLSGILLRSIDAADGWQILFYRGISFFLTLAPFLAAHYRRQLPAAIRATGGRGILVAAFLSIASLLYVYGMLLTTVANVVFIQSSAPLITALVARAVLGERVRAGTWVAMVVAFCGIALMVADGLAAGGLGGIACALGVACCSAGMLTTLRRSTAVDMLPAICASGLLTAAVALPLMPAIVISAHDLLLCMLLGIVQFGAGFILITLGTRWVPAAEVALLSLTETVLAPVWAWLGAGEVPSTLTLAGGAVVLAAVALRAVSGHPGAETAGPAREP